MRDFKAKKGSLKSKTERRLAKWLYGIGRCCLFGKLSASRRCSVACRFGKDFRLPQSWQQQPIAPHAIQAQRQPENVFGGCCRFAETCFACFQAVPLSGADLLPAQAFRRLPRAGASPCTPCSIRHSGKICSLSRRDAATACRQVTPPAHSHSPFSGCRHIIKQPCPFV